MISSAAERVHGPSLSFIQWQIQGRGSGDLGPRLIFIPNWGQKCRKKFFGDLHPPFIWTIAPLLISRSGSGTVIYHLKYYNTSPMLSLFADMAGPRQGSINWNTFYFSKYINSHDSFYWQIFHNL